MRSSHTDVLVRSSHTDVLAILLMLVDVPAVTSWCLLVVQFQNLFMRMSGGNEKEPQAKIKKINCASLLHAPRCLSITSKVPPTTDGTRLTTAWSLTSALLESRSHCYGRWGQRGSDVSRRRGQRGGDVSRR